MSSGITLRMFTPKNKRKEKEKNIMQHAELLL